MVHKTNAARFLDGKNIPYELVEYEVDENPNFKWEMARKFNAGLEIGLFNALNITIDVFNEKRDNILITKESLPSLIGVPRSTIAPFNLGKVENKGYEVEMTYSKSINRDLFVIVKGNINYNDNKVLYIDELQRDNTYATTRSEERR